MQFRETVEVLSSLKVIILFYPLSKVIILILFQMWQCLYSVMLPQYVFYLIVCVRRVRVCERERERE